MKHLDTLRAFALLLVMVEHYGGKTLNEHIPIGAGSVGVGCFFTLSGFLISGILLESFDAHIESKSAVWLDFYARRLLRLMPAYYLVILILVLLDMEPIASSWPWHAAYLTNVWIALGHPDNVFWSLSVEEQFYLFWPFVIAFAPRRWLLPAIFGIMAFSLLFKLGVLLAGFNTRDVNRLLFGNLVLLGAGCALAVFSYRSGRANCFDWYTGNTARRFRAAAWLGLGLAVLSWWFFPKDGGLVRYFTNDLLVGVFYAWVVLQAAIGIGGLLNPVFESELLQYIGRISYGLYLVHNWVPDIVEKYVGRMPKYEAGPIVLAVTFGFCSLSWHFFERPISRLKRYFWNAPLRKPVEASNPREPDGAVSDSRRDAEAARIC
ncbi:MAG TPA: acyltransferase [Rhizomicrobium sp.]|nr:acyltransferase [Rhizomicrobium sp.]